MAHLGSQQWLLSLEIQAIFGREFEYVIKRGGGAYPAPLRLPDL